jgi:hypothetical protein
MSTLEISRPSLEEWEQLWGACDAFLRSYVQPLLLAGVSPTEIDKLVAVHPEHKRLTDWSMGLQYRRDRAEEIAAERRFRESIEANRERWQRMVSEGRYSYRLAIHHWFAEAYCASTGRCHLQGPYAEPEVEASIELLTCRICGSYLTPGCECNSPFGKDLA